MKKQRRAVYKWRGSGHKFYHSKVDAQSAGEFIEMLKAEQGGHVSCRDIIDAARPANSPIHAGFEWDAEKGHERFLLLQAQSLMTAYTVVYEGEKEPRLVNVSVFSHGNGDGRTYTSLEAAIKNPAMRDQLYREAVATLHGAQQRFHMLRFELSGVFREIDRLPKKRKAKGRKQKIA